MELNGYLWMGWGLYWLALAGRVNKTREAENNLSRYLHLAPTGLAFALIFTHFFDFSIFNLRWLPENRALVILGDAITLIGLSFAVWARIHLGKYWSGIVTLKEGHRLIRTGPYRLARHPIYTGMIFGFIGSAIALGELRGVFAVLIIVIAYLRKIRVEEKILLREFGEEYERFRKEVKALIPYVL
jgi:protein-S-isoprenylcysteine O-methyltransferase Ste14